MNPFDLLEKARRVGVNLEARGDKLAVTPPGKLPNDLRAELVANKAELLAWLNSLPCPGWRAVPPRDLPLRPGEPLPNPAARVAVIDYVFRQLPPPQPRTPPSPLRGWIERRECAYYDGPGAAWRCESFAFAAARDCATWQLACDESQLLEKLAVFEAVAKIQ